jgi:catechol 2,3-dioxygenase-like lactoylglutathione lyase family enzyme
MTTPVTRPRLHHLGLTVSDLGAALEWYREMFDAEAVFVEEASGPGLDAMVQVDGTHLRYAMVDLDGTLVELLEYSRPGGAEFTARNCDIGATHVCVVVPDIEAAYERLQGLGIVFTSEPSTMGPPVEGHRQCYFRGFDGVQYELWQYPA